ncbi:T9SS type A sorting domain-containing protein [Tamlana flava]|uniref:T9SS type A sorting domain-containing protein n=1 Tax=Tamlana flava TaxID=3158572 RepID=UPI00351BE479
MLKNYSSLALLFLVLGILNAQTTAIPDANFEQALINLGIDTDGTINQSVATADISDVTVLDVHSKSITDLTGIEGFTSLTHLVCSYNQLTDLDLSQNTNLIELTCNDNQLINLNVTQNTVLTRLQCFNNTLETIDVTKNTALTFLNFNNNQLTSIDITKNTLITSLGLTSNQLTTLDVSKNTALYYLQCQANQLTDLDVSKNIALSIFYCFSNQLTNLDVSLNTALVSLNCGRNQLTALNVSNNILLTQLNCDDNLFTDLILDQNTALVGLVCYGNPLTSLDLSHNINLEELYFFNNILTDIDLSYNVALRTVYCAGSSFTSLDLGQNPALTYVDCSYSQNITTLNVKNGNNNSLVFFNARSCNSLGCIQVDDETLANNDGAPYSTWIKNDTTVYSEDCAALSIDENDLGQFINLYPNPVINHLTIDSKKPLKKVEIYSILGTKVKNIKSNYTSIPMFELSEGIYIIRLESSTGIFNKKILKK